MQAEGGLQEASAERQGLPAALEWWARGWHEATHRRLVLCMAECNMNLCKRLHELP